MSRQRNDSFLNQLKSMFNLCVWIQAPTGNANPFHPVMPVEPARQDDEYTEMEATIDRMDDELAGLMTAGSKITKLAAVSKIESEISILKLQLVDYKQTL